MSGHDAMLGGRCFRGGSYHRTRQTGTVRRRRGHPGIGTRFQTPEIM